MEVKHRGKCLTVARRGKGSMARFPGTTWVPQRSMAVATQKDVGRGFALGLFSPIVHEITLKRPESMNP